MNSAIILAAGSGKRSGLSYNKVFADLSGHPILYWTIKAFEECEKIDEIVLVLKEEEKEYFIENFKKYSFKKIRTIVIGGKERQDSVLNGLGSVDEKTEIVLIHDGARCLVSRKIIEDGIFFASKYKAATPGVVPKDTFKIVDENGFIKSSTNRSELRSVQTPQCFDYQLIKKAYETMCNDEKLFTDDNEVLSEYSKKEEIHELGIFIYEGEYKNIKITTQDDLLSADILLKN